MPPAQAWSSTGPITNAVRNSASPTSTWLDGVAPVPSAWRSRAMTMMMRVNAVIASSAAGSSVIALISSSTCSDTDHCCPPCGRSVTVTAGRPPCCWANAGPAAQSSSMARRGRQRFMRRPPVS